MSTAWLCVQVTVSNIAEDTYGLTMTVGLARAHARTQGFPFSSLSLSLSLSLSRLEISEENLYACYLSLFQVLVEETIVRDES